MKALHYLPLPLVRLLAFLYEELREARPGRTRQTILLWGNCLLVVLISMTFRIPFLAISLAVLFYGIQSNAFYTRFVALLFVVATVIEILSLLLIYKWTYSYPLLRMVIASVIVLGSMFMMRTHRLGLVFFAVAIVAIYGQTFPGMLDYPETVLRLTLWCIVVGLYPTLLMVLTGVLWFPGRARTQMRKALCEQLDDAVSRLTTPAVPLPEKKVEQAALSLQKLNVFCMADAAAWRAKRGWWQMCIATVSYVYATLNRYDISQMPDDPQARQLLETVRQQIVALKASIARDEIWRSAWQPSPQEAIVARSCGLFSLCQLLLALGQRDPDAPSAPVAKPPAMVADALSNPAYIRYALKTLLACMICYIFYSGVDWEGIHTCMLTCIIVANPGIGSSYQKMALRVGGALSGAVLALLLTIFVIPWLDNIVELLCVLAPIFLLGAWIASGSERSSYIGTQLVVTFALATLENVFGPVYDLVEIRDRAIGILLGTLVSAVVYTFIWPESEAEALPKKLAAALEILSKLMRLTGQQAAVPDDYLQLRTGFIVAINGCREICERVALERHLGIDERDRLLRCGQQTIHHGHEILYAWEALRAHDAMPDAEQTEMFVGALESYLGGLAGAESPPPALSPRQFNPQEQYLMQQIACLPDWRRLSPTRLQARGVSQ